VTGKLVWRWPVPENGALYTGFNAAPVVDGGILVVGGLDGNLYGFPIR
jgi:outer membrane protein assembly factor BamB